MGVRPCHHLLCNRVDLLILERQLGSHGRCRQVQQAPSDSHDRLVGVVVVVQEGRRGEHCRKVEAVFLLCAGRIPRRRSCAGTTGSMEPVVCAARCVEYDAFGQLIGERESSIRSLILQCTLPLGLVSSGMAFNTTRPHDGYWGNNVAASCLTKFLPELSPCYRRNHQIKSFVRS